MNAPETGMDSLAMKNDHDCCCGKRNVLEQHPGKCQALGQYIDELHLSSDEERRRGHLIGCLHKAQEFFGYLPPEVQELVGKKLRLQQSDIYGVISFYSFFTDQPVGKYKVSVCTGTACFVRGAGRILDEFKSALNLAEGQTSDDMKFTLTSIRCLGACSLAPVVMVNDRVYGNMVPKMVAEIIRNCG